MQVAALLKRTGCVDVLLAAGVARIINPENLAELAQKGSIVARELQRPPTVSLMHACRRFMQLRIHTELRHVWAHGLLNHDTVARDKCCRVPAQVALFLTFDFPLFGVWDA